MSSNKTGFK